MTETTTAATDAATTTAATTATQGAATQAASGVSGGAADVATTQAAQTTDAKTLATGATDTTKTITAPADFPADWREKVAGEDKAFLNDLKRYGAPGDALKALRALKLQISAGELKAPTKPPAENAKPEEIAAWRKEQGLPEKATDYVANLKLGDGVVPGEADKPLLEAVAEMAFKGNHSQETVNDFVGTYYKLQDQLVAQRHEADQDQRIQAEQQLIKDMGADFKPNMHALNAFWRGQPEGLQDLVLGGRTADGRVIGNLPEVTAFFANLARELNPAAALLPPGTDGTPASVQGRMAEIEKQMYIDGKPNPGYFGGPMEVEYRNLIDAQERMKARAA